MASRPRTADLLPGVGRKRSKKKIGGTLRNKDASAPYVGGA